MQQKQAFESHQFPSTTHCGSYLLLNREHNFYYSHTVPSSGTLLYLLDTNRRKRPGAEINHTERWLRNRESQLATSRLPTAQANDIHGDVQLQPTRPLCGGTTKVACTVGDVQCTRALLQGLITFLKWIECQWADLINAYDHSTHRNTNSLILHTPGMY